MSATTALGAAPPEAAGEETAVVDRREEAQKVTEETEKREEQKVAKDAEEEAAVVEAAAQEVAAEDEADDTDVSEEETVIAEEALEALTPALSQGEREESAQQEAERQESARREAATRVRQSAGLPPGMRERLAAIVESGGQVASDGTPLVSIEQAIQAVSEALPDSLRLNVSQLARPEHPSGEAFFSGRTAEELTDQQAEEIARGQLARSGFARGQRVRVGD
jgi:hypothetical protein